MLKSLSVPSDIVAGYCISGNVHRKECECAVNDGMRGEFLPQNGLQATHPIADPPKWLLHVCNEGVKV